MSGQSRTSLCVLILLLVVPAFSWLAALQTPDQAAIIQLLHKGRDVMQSGDLPGAEVLFRQVVMRAPDLSDAWLGLGLVQLRSAQPGLAVQSLTRAVKLNPQLPGAHLFLGIAQNQVGQPNLAATSIEAELALHPDNVEALTWLGIIHLADGHPEAATVPLDRAMTLSPRDPQLLYYRARVHMLVAEATYRELSELDPDSSLVHRGMAESYDIAGQSEKAIAEYEEAIRKDPANPDLYEALGEADLKMSRTDAARQAFEQELKLNPASPIALYNLGRIAVEHGEPTTGVALLRRAEGAHASPAPTNFYLGLGLAEIGQNAEAALWLERSLANHPSSFVERGCWYQLGRVYQKLDRKRDSEHARAELTRLLDEQQREKDATSKRLASQSIGSSTPVPANTPPRR